MEKFTRREMSPAPAQINDGQVFLALLDFSLFEEIAPYRHLLNPEERKRADKFYFEKDKNRFVITRGILKSLLGRYNKINAARISFGQNAYGKPLMEHNPYHFNVAHSGNYGLLGLTKIADIGVDIEQFRAQTDLEAIARRFFSRVEIAEFSALPESERQQGFFNAWTRKEAFIKAVGMGLSLPLHAFDVRLSPNHEAGLSDVRYEGLQSTDWNLDALEAPPGYAAAFCLKSSTVYELIYYKLQPEF